VLHEDDLVDSLAKSGDYDVIIYGHTHRTDIRKIGNTLIVNPGELCGWLTGKYTVAIIDTENLNAKIISIV